jgi:hypothetical protein
MTVAPLAAIISSYSLLAIPVILLLQRPVRMDPTFRLLFIYAIVAFVVDRIPELIVSTSSAARVLSFAFTIFEYTVFTLFFYRFFQRKTYKKWVLAGSVIFLITLVFELQKFGIVYYSRLNAGTAVILIISYSLLLFHEWLMDDPMELIHKKAAFWITLGCLVYLSGNFFFFITVGKQWEQNWAMHAVSNLFKNLLFVTAILLQVFPATPPRKIV